MAEVFGRMAGYLGIRKNALVVGGRSLKLFSYYSVFGFVKIREQIDRQTRPDGKILAILEALLKKSKIFGPVRLFYKTSSVHLLHFKYPSGHSVGKIGKILAWDVEKALSIDAQTAHIGIKTFQAREDEGAIHSLAAVVRKAELQAVLDLLKTWKLLPEKIYCLVTHPAEVFTDLKIENNCAFIQYQEDGYWECIIFRDQVVCGYLRWFQGKNGLDHITSRRLGEMLDDFRCALSAKHYPVYFFGPGRRVERMQVKRIAESLSLGFIFQEPESDRHDRDNVIPADVSAYAGRLGRFSLEFIIPEVRRMFIRHSFGRAVVLFLLMIDLASFVFTPYFISVHSRVDQLNIALSGSETKDVGVLRIRDRLAGLKALEEIQAREVALDEKMSGVKAFGAEPSTVRTALYEIAIHVPARLHLTELILRNSQCELQGVAVSSDELKSFLEGLSRSSYFVNVVLRKAESLRENNQVMFVINARVKP